MASGYGPPITKETVLASKPDPVVERWIKSISKAKDGGKIRSKRFRIPNIGKPKAVQRGKINLRKAAAHHVYKRRVVVLTYHYRMAGKGMPKLHSHLRYIERPEAQPDVKDEKSNGDRLFNGEGAVSNGHPIVQSWQDDRHHFRIILAPNDGHSLDMHRFVREYMAELEKATGTKLEWVAAVHEKPDLAHKMNRHAHIVMRGICDDGSDLVLKREFIVHEARRIASDLATDQLGFMGQHEVNRLNERKAERERTGNRTYHAGHRPRRKEKEQAHG